MPQPNDQSRSLVALDQNSTIIVVVATVSLPNLAGVIGDPSSGTYRDHRFSRLKNGPASS